MTQCWIKCLDQGDSSLCTLWMKWTILEKRSITVRIIVLLLDGWRLVTKSRAICDRGGKEWEGCSGPTVGWWELVLSIKLCKHPRTDGCPQAWPATKTVDGWLPATSSHQAGTLVWSSDPNARRQCKKTARDLTWPLTPQVTAPTTRPEGRIVSERATSSAVLPELGYFWVK